MARGRITRENAREIGKLGGRPRGSVHPAILVALFHYAAGKPPARVEVTTPSPGRAELAARMRLLPNADRLALI